MSHHILLGNCQSNPLTLLFGVRRCTRARSACCWASCASRRCSPARCCCTPPPRPSAAWPPGRSGGRRRSTPRGCTCAPPPPLAATRSTTRRPVRALLPLAYSDAQVANRDWDFGWGVAHGAVTRRPPISLDTMVLRTGGCAYDVGVWAVCRVQGALSVAPCQTLEPELRFATFASLYPPLRLL
jgi:hypothetical protein